MNWMKQQLANVAGTQEPVYGPSAIQPVTEQATTGTSYTELTKVDLRWAAISSTCVETQTFYVTTDNGYTAMVQLIYNSVAGIRTTCQFNSKIFNYPNDKGHLWNSDPLSNHYFDKQKFSFHADKCFINLSDDGSYFTIKSMTSPKCVVDLKFTRVAPGFVVGKNGTSYFGTDSKNPWGSMRHAFWPRCKVEGSFMTQTGEVRMDGRGMFVHALQGMKPHHAAARWNFAMFQSDIYSAVLMEFTTPVSYGSTKVNVGGIVTDDKILYAGADNSATHTEIKGDKDVDWPEPGAIKFQWNVHSRDNDETRAEMLISPLQRVDRVDVMAEVPGFVKQIVANAAGTRPYIYMYLPTPTLQIQSAGEAKDVPGRTFMECVFIS